MKADNPHHGGICEYCYQTSSFVPVDQPRQPIKHLEDCQRHDSKAQAYLAAIKHGSDESEEYIQHRDRMTAAARSMTKPLRGNMGE